MLSIDDILGLDFSGALSDFEIQQAYDELVRCYHPEHYPDKVNALSLFLQDGDILEREHKLYSLRALESITKAGQPLPIGTLYTLSILLLDANQPELHELCCHILAYCACNKQLLPEAVIRILELVLKYGCDPLSTIAASALSGVLSNHQILTSTILQLTESAFIREHQDKLDIVAFLYQLITQPNSHELSRATYEALCDIIVGTSQSRETQNQCYNIVLACAQLGHDIPDIVFKALITIICHSDQTFIKKAHCVFMNCLVQDKNRGHIEACTLTNVIFSLKKALSSQDLQIAYYAACTLGYLQLMDVDTYAMIPQDLLVNYLEKALENVEMSQYAVVPLHHILSQKKHGLLSDALLILAQMSHNPEYHRSLRKKAIELMGLSARHNRNAFSLDALEQLACVLREKDPELSKACLSTLSYHLDNLDGAKVLPYKIMKQIRSALYQIETSSQQPVQNVDHQDDIHLQGERTLPQLLAQLKQDNQDNLSILQQLEDNTLTDKLDEIAAAHEVDSVLFPLKKPIKHWEHADCLGWAKHLKAHPDEARDPAFLAEIIAVISQGVILATNHTPRLTQFLSLLLLLDAKDHGRLAQIATGEGKSMTVAMLAAIKALQGEKVDVVSSSPLLAFRDTEANTVFFKQFDLTVACNWNPHAGHYDFPGVKRCYLADIVYGDANQFQFDLLRDEYKEKNTRGNRAYDTVIVDEVDSMLIDESMKIAQLASHKPLMAELEVLFISVWIELCRRKVALERGEVPVSMNEKTGEPFTTLDYLQSVAEQCFLKIIHDPDAHAAIPKHLQAFALSQAPHWARSAALAMERYVLGQDYVITQEEDHDIIAPVDYMNTGVTHENSVWDDGLQQFLQLKHGLAFSAESLTASFISNRAYFKRYDQRIYGLTGTLGAKDEQALLKEIYQLDLAFIPTYKEKQFEEIPGFLAETSDEWLLAVVTRVKQDIEAGRAVLVICESINAAHQIEEALRDANITNISSYTRSDHDERCLVLEKASPGKVILSTNLFGRGNDIQTTDEVEENGGLDVCVTFLPKNVRVEQQAFGRTSRQGHRGTAQLVIHKTEAVARLMAQCPDGGDADTMENLKAWRNEAEARMLQVIKTVELQKIVFKDALFAQFCEFMRTLRAMDNNEAKLDEIEEQWGFWLKTIVREMAQATIVDEVHLNTEFERFKQQAYDNFLQEHIQNPSQWVNLGNSYGLKDNTQLKAAYSKAIEIDSRSMAAAQAYYRRAYVSLSEQHKGAALSDLQSAKSLLEDHIIPKLEVTLQLLHLMPNPSQTTAANIEQIQKKIHLLKIQIAYIARDLSVIGNAERDIEIRGSKTLGSLFKGDAPWSEIRELEHLGLPYLFEIREKQAKKQRGVGAWLRRTLVAVAGICQVIIGVSLSAMGGIYWGKALIEMGVSDILFAVRSALESTACSWMEYRAHKIVSTAIILATIGIDVMREGHKAAKQTTQTAANQATFASRAETQVVKAVQKGIIREGIHFGLSAAAKGAIAHYKEDIKQSVRDALLNHFNQDNFKQQIDKILAIDVHYGHSEQARKLQQLAFDIMRPKRNALASMGESIFKGVVANQLPIAGVVMKLADVTFAIDKITHLCDDFCDEFSARLPLIIHQLPPTKVLLEKDLSPVRQKLYDSIIKQITECVISYLHDEAAVPLMDVMIAPRIQTWVSESLISGAEAPPKKPPQMMNLTPSLSVSEIVANTTEKDRAKRPQKSAKRPSHQQVDPKKQQQQITFFKTDSRAETEKTSLMGKVTSFFIPSAEASVREERVKEVKHFYVSDESQASGKDGNFIGIVFYDYHEKREVNVGGKTIKEGHIVFCPPEWLDEPLTVTFHRQLLNRVMGERNFDFDDNFTASGFARQDGEWKRNSRSLNARLGRNYTRLQNHQMSDYEFNEVIKTVEDFLAKQSQASLVPAP